MIEVKNLKKEFELATPLTDVNTTINEGDVIAVIGPSGTGKSTLLRCLNMLDKPSAGHVLIDGEDITNPNCDINRIRRKLGMVFQSFNLYEHLTVVENCMLAQTVLLKRSRQEAYDKAMKLLSSVGMDKQALQYPFELSGGQKQRVAIARTLSTDPEIILFDEPTSALDPISTAEIETIIEQLKLEGRTMLIVTHSMDFAKRISNRVFYMDQGIIYEEGTPEQIFDKPQKSRTHDFVVSLSSLDMTVYEKTHNLETEIGKIYNFCKLKGIDEKRIMRACGFYEECYLMLSKYFFNEDKTLYMRLEYEKNTDRLIFDITPGSSKLWSDIADIVLNSLEYRIFASYINSYREETETDKGIGYMYRYEIK